MKNITELLKDAGIDMPEDKKADFDKSFKLNYKTINDYDNTKERLEAERDGYKTQLDDVSTKLKAFDGVDVDSLKNEITKLSGDLTAAETNHKEELAKRDRAAETATFFSSLPQKFVNDETRSFYLDKLEAALDDETNKNKSRQEILDSFIKNEKGEYKTGVFAEEQKKDGGFGFGGKQPPNDIDAFVSALQPQ